MFLYYLTSHSSISDLDNFRFEISVVTSDNSHYSIIKDLFTTFDASVETSTFKVGYDVDLAHQVAGLKAQVRLTERCRLSNSDLEIRQSQIAVGGGEGIRTPDPRVANAVLCQLSYAPISIAFSKGWLRGRDLNPRPLGYEPNELPDCSTPRQINSQI